MLDDKTLQDIEKLSPFDLQYSEIASQAKELIEKEIPISESIQELVNNALLETWVKKGREYHKERKTCAFCGNDLPEDLKDKLDKHFKQESAKLRQNLEELIHLIQKEQSKINSFKIDK